MTPLRPIPKPRRKPGLLVQWLRQAGKRWRQESPVFFVRLRKFGLWLAGIPALVLTIQSIPQVPVELTALAASIATYAAVAGVVIAAVSKLTVKDPE